MSSVKIINIFIAISIILLFTACESPQLRRFNYFMSTRDESGAKIYIQNEINKYPGNAELHFLLGNIYIAEQDFSSARLAFQSASAITPKYDEDISLLLERHFRLELQAAIEAFENQNYSAAITHLEHTRSIYEDRNEIYSLLGYVHLQLDQLNEAENAYRKAVELNNNDIGDLNNLAELLYRRGEYASAIRYAERILSQNGQHSNAHLLCVYSYLALGYFEEAEQYYNSFFRNHYSGSLKINFAIGLYNQGEYNRALPYLLAIVEFGDTYHEIILSLAETYHHLGDYRSMAHWYEYLRRFQPENRDIIKNLISAYEMLGETSNSKKYRNLLIQ